jgi:glucosamine--fructose-6-phosphate aminotransferase (isomerizing)
MSDPGAGAHPGSFSRTGPTLMAQEIDATPDVVRRLLTDGGADLAGAGAALAHARPAWVSFVARGSSDHVATYGRYLVETALGVPAMLAAASVTTVYEAPLRWSGGALVAISQSGRSPDVVAVTAAARRGGALTIAITNDPRSPLAEAADEVVPILAGPEEALAATKTFTASLVAIASVVARAAGRRHLAQALPRVPAVLADAIAAGRRWIDGSGATAAFAGADRAIVTGRGFDLATALEIAIKLQETSGIAALGLSSADLEHGPIALAREPGVPVLAIRPDGVIGRRVDGALDRLRAGGAVPWVIGGQEAPIAPDPTAGPRPLQLPVELPTALGPIVRVIPGQLLAEAVAIQRGRDPDRPIGLSKVTLTH